MKVSGRPVTSAPVDNDQLECVCEAPSFDRTGPRKGNRFTVAPDCLHFLSKLRLEPLTDDFGPRKQPPDPMDEHRHHDRKPESHVDEKPGNRVRHAQCRDDYGR